ncbi:MAG: response regulator transcription factor [Anaerolineales bacterium]|nr:response regulator transcription factor [Anaerolineales bacterium]
MNDENRAAAGMNMGQFDEGIDPSRSEKGLTRAEIELSLESGKINLTGEVIDGGYEDARGNALTQTQIEAASLVALGFSDTEIAWQVGVSRKSVNRWKNHNIFFMEEVTAKRAEIWESYRNQFRLMMPKAIEVIKAMLDYGDEKRKMEAAMFILRAVKLGPIGLEKRKGG